jgi:hypothetical protein
MIYELIWSSGGMILTGENGGLGENLPQTHMDCPGHEPEPYVIKTLYCDIIHSKCYIGHCLSLTTG